MGLRPPHSKFCGLVRRYRFVFCRQRQDQKLRRGGEQKSVVVLSVQPYSSVLGQLSQFAGSMYFNHGTEALEEVWQFSVAATGAAPSPLDACCHLEQPLPRTQIMLRFLDSNRVP